MKTKNILTCRQTIPGSIKCILNLSELYPSQSERNKFIEKYRQFRRNDTYNRHIYRMKGNKLVFNSEQLIPSKTDDRLPLMLVFGNPASHSVKEGMFFSFEGDGREHRFWKDIMRPSGILDIALDSDLPVQERNRHRKKRLLSLDYDSPFRIALCVFVSLPSSASKPRWSGISGVQKLLGIRAMRILEQFERVRILRVAEKFLRNGGIVVTFQKNAWEGLCSDRDPSYSIEFAKKGKLEGRLRGLPDIPLFGVPPTRLSSPCREVLKKFLIGKGANCSIWKSKEV